MTTDAPTSIVPPPVDAAPVRWHLIVGILGILYGLLGGFAHLALLGSVFFYNSLLEMSGMRDVRFPMSLMVTAVLQSGILLILAVILAVGSVLVLMRRPRGASLMRLWAGARVFMVLVGVAAGFLQMPAQVDFQVQVAEAQRSMLRDRNVPEDRLPPADRETVQTRFLWTTIGIGVVTLAFPIFVGVLFTNRKKLDEVESWKLIER
jgi:hypothetical protein